MYKKARCTLIFIDNGVKRRQVVHCDEDEEECDTEELQAELKQQMHDGTVAHRVPARFEKRGCSHSKTCKCGSTIHQHIFMHCMDLEYLITRHSYSKP